MSNIPWSNKYGKKEQRIVGTLWLLDFHIHNINLKIKNILLQLKASFNISNWSLKQYRPFMLCCFGLGTGLEKEISTSSELIDLLCDITISPKVYIFKGNESGLLSSHCETISWTMLHMGQGLLPNDLAHLSHIVCPQFNNKGITPRKGTNSETK